MNHPKSIYIVLWIVCSILSFFPVYVGYQPHLMWIWLTITMIFACTTYIPWIRTYTTKGLYSLLILCVFGLCIESLGVLTCRPYGCFEYSSQLGPKLFNIVPYMLIMTRPPLVIGVWSIVKNFVWRWWKRWLVWWVWLVAVDIILDPLAVLMGIWNYPWWWFRFGVPLSNFWWRMISGTIGIMIIDYCIGKQHQQSYQIYGLLLNLFFFIAYWIRTYFL